MEAPVWTRRSVGWLFGMVFVTTGLATAVTLLNLAGRVIMEMGGFVAVGGPYEIAHPAPGWIALVPGSIFLGFACGGLSMILSMRTGGFSLLPLTWCSLFVSLGVQFAIMGLNPPGPGGPAWGWIICAVVFIPMGLTALPAVVRGRELFGMPRMSTLWGSTPPPYGNPRYKQAYIASVIAGIVGGVAAAFILFKLTTG